MKDKRVSKVWKPFQTNIAHVNLWYRPGGGGGCWEEVPQSVPFQVEGYHSLWSHVPSRSMDTPVLSQVLPGRGVAPGVIPARIWMPPRKD